MVFITTLTPGFFKNPVVFITTLTPGFFKNPVVFITTLTPGFFQEPVVFITTLTPGFFKNPVLFFQKIPYFIQNFRFLKIPLLKNPSFSKKTVVFITFFKILQSYKKGSTDLFFNSKHGNKHVR